MTETLPPPKKLYCLGTVSGEMSRDYIARAANPALQPTAAGSTSGRG